MQVQFSVLFCISWKLLVRQKNNKENGSHAVPRSLLKPMLFLCVFPSHFHSLANKQQMQIKQEKSSQRLCSLGIVWCLVRTGCGAEVGLGGRVKLGSSQEFMADKGGCFLGVCAWSSARHHTFYQFCGSVGRESWKRPCLESVLPRCTSQWCRGHVCYHPATLQLFHNNPFARTGW